MIKIILMQLVIKIIIYFTNSKYLKVPYVNDINYVLSWKSRGFTETTIEAIKTNNYLLDPQIDHYVMSKIRIKFDGSFLNRFPSTILHRDIVNIYIVYEITSTKISIILK